MCDRYPEGNTQVGQVSGWLVGGREADEHGDSGDGSSGRQRQQRSRGQRRERAEGAHEARSARRSAPGRTGAWRGVHEHVSLRLDALHDMCKCVDVARDRSFARAVRQRPAAWLSGSARPTSCVGACRCSQELSCFVPAVHSPENVFSQRYFRSARSLHPVTHTVCLRIYGCMAPPVHQLSVQPDTL